MTHSPDSIAAPGSAAVDRIIEVVASGVELDLNTEDIARLVLSAMREPTEAMIEVGRRGAPEHVRLTRESLLFRWQAMIDEALK